MMLPSTKRRLEGLERSIGIVMERLTDLNKALAQLAPAPAESGFNATLLEAFGSTIKQLAEAASASQSHTQEVLDKLVDKAAKRVFQPLASEMGRKGAEVSAEVRRNKRDARELGLPTLPEWVMACEECKAAVFNRAPKHTDDMIRHSREMHKVKLAQDLNIHVGPVQQELPT